jgi:hypothetical protein
MRRLFHEARSLRLAMLIALIALGAIFGVAVGCSGTLGGPGEAFGGGGASATSGTGTSTSTGMGGDMCQINCNTTSSGGGGNPGQLVITPPSAALTVANGMIPTQQFKAMLGNTDVSNQVTWSYGRPEIGDIGAGAVFTPTGNVGGVAKLTASINKLSTDADVSVTIQKTVNTAGLTPAQIGQFGAPNGGPDPSVNIVYPYKDTVFPLGVLAPEVMWNGGGGGDIYQLTVTEKYYQYTEFFSAPPPSTHLVSEPDWKSIEDSGSGPKTDPVQVALTRMVGGTVYQPVSSVWHVAQGRLHGSVYYWELPDACGNAATGRVLRIKPDSTATDQFYPTGTCYGCHTVSRDGKTMMASFDDAFPFPQRTIDLTQNPAQLGAIQNGPTGTFSAFNDKGDKILVSDDASSNSTKTLRILDASNASGLNGAPLGGGNCGEPAWSPDGKTIAGICNLNAFGWVFDAPNGDLTLADVAADGFTTTNVRTLVPNSPGQGRPAYPSFAPGSEYLAFGRPTAGSRSTGQGQLWMVKTDGTEMKELSTAEAGLNNSYNPVFAPLRAGGYFWLVFISRRDYGNHQALKGANRQQLWITAIEDPPSAADPSQPAFYMRGQEDCGKSENAYYALDPCKALGADCTSGVDCCGGQCVKDPQTMMYVCGMPPPPGQCSQDGNSCKVKSDCCNTESDCIDGFCQSAPPK